MLGCGHDRTITLRGNIFVTVSEIIFVIVSDLDLYRKTDFK